MQARVKQPTKAEEEAIYLVAFASECSTTNDWKMLEQEIVEHLKAAEMRGVKRKTASERRSQLCISCRGRRK